jgi:hypothetical protein
MEIASNEEIQKSMNAFFEYKKYWEELLEKGTALLESEIHEQMDLLSVWANRKVLEDILHLRVRLFDADRDLNEEAVLKRLMNHCELSEIPFLNTDCYTKISTLCHQVLSIQKSLSVFGYPVRECDLDFEKLMSRASISLDNSRVKRISWNYAWPEYPLDGSELSNLRVLEVEEDQCVLGIERTFDSMAIGTIVMSGIKKGDFVKCMVFEPRTGVYIISYPSKSDSDEQRLNTPQYVNGARSYIEETIKALI